MYWLIDRGRNQPTLFRHDIAGHAVACPWPLWASASPVNAPPLPIDDLEPEQYQRCEALLGGRTRALTYAECRSGRTVVRFDHGLELWIGTDTVSAQVSQSVAQTDVQEALLGPGLLMLLAGDRHFALHASAVSAAQGLDLLLGPSGQGKSTLARLATRLGLARHADDLVVLDRELCFAGVFPQLKLQPPILPAPERPMIGRLIWPEFHEGDARLIPLPAAEVRKRLIRDSVAARLFSPALLSQHLNFVSRLSQQVPGYRLCRPRVSAEGLESASVTALAVLQAAG